MTLPLILRSKLSREFSADGVTIFVEIFRVRALVGWAMEITTVDGHTIAWEQVFATEDDAWQSFLDAVDKFTMVGLLTLTLVERTRIH